MSLGGIDLQEKINLKDLEKAISKNPITIGEINGQKVIFNPNIPYEKIISICKNIANNILEQDGTYFPELKDILIFCFVVKNMTNLPIKEDKDQNLDMDFIYKLMVSDIGIKLKNHLKTDMTYQFLNRETKELLNYKKEIYFRSIKNKTFENLDNLILELQSMAKKISSFADEHKNLVKSKTINKMIETLDKFKKQ